MTWPDKMQSSAECEVKDVEVTGVDGDREERRRGSMEGGNMVALLILDSCRHEPSWRKPQPSPGNGSNTETKILSL